MKETPRWYLPVVVAAILWNLMGCVTYLVDVTLTPEDLAAMTAAQQALYEVRPWWALVGTGLAVWGGLFGCVGLLLRRTWAVPLLMVSLVGVVVQDLGVFILAEGLTLMQPVGIALQSVVLVVAVALVWLGRHARAKGWLMGGAPLAPA